MQSQLAEAIVHDTAQLSVEVAPLKVGPGIVRHVGIAIGALIPMFTVLHPLSRRIELVCHPCQLEKSGQGGNGETLPTRYRPSALKS